MTKLFRNIFKLPLIFKLRFVNLEKKLTNTLTNVKAVKHEPSTTIFRQTLFLNFKETVPVQLPLTISHSRCYIVTYANYVFFFQESPLKIEHLITIK